MKNNIKSIFAVLVLVVLISACVKSKGTASAGTSLETPRDSAQHESFVPNSQNSMYEVLLSSAEYHLKEYTENNKEDSAIKALDCIKIAYLNASNNNASENEFRTIADFFGKYLEHISVEYDSRVKHNAAQMLLAKYDGKTELKSSIIFETSKDDGEAKVSIGTFNSVPGKAIANIKALQIMQETIDKHSFKLSPTEKKKNIYNIKDAGLYAAAILSTDIPEFAVISDNDVINLAACVKAVIDASCLHCHWGFGNVLQPFLSMADSYDKNKGLASELSAMPWYEKLDDMLLYVKKGTHRADVRFIPKDKYSTVSVIFEEIFADRLLIAINKDGEYPIGLVTYISLKPTGKGDYDPVSVKMRIPSLPKDQQKKEISWKEFTEKNIALVTVKIY